MSRARPAGIGPYPPSSAGASSRPSRVDWEMVTTRCVRRPCRVGSTGGSHQPSIPGTTAPEQDDAWSEPDTKLPPQTLRSPKASPAGPPPTGPTAAGSRSAGFTSAGFTSAEASLAPSQPPAPLSLSLSLPLPLPLPLPSPCPVVAPVDDDSVEAKPGKKSATEQPADVLAAVMVGGAP